MFACICDLFELLFFLYPDLNLIEFTSTLFQGTQYLLSIEVPMTDINDFQDNCKSAGGYLAEINTKEEYNFIMGFLNSRIPNRRSTAYVGATDEDNEGSWVFMNSGRPADFLNFHGNYGYRGTAYNCLKVIWGGSDTGMGDWKCENGGNRRFLCEVEKDEGESTTFFYIN